MTQKESKKSRRIYSIPRILRIAFVMVTLLAFVGWVIGVIALVLADLPSRESYSDQFWMNFVGWSLMLGSIVILAFVRELSPNEEWVYPELAIAGCLALLIGAMVVTFEAFYPSLGKATAASVLLGCFMLNFLSLGIFVSFEWARKNRGSENGSEEQGR